MNIAIADFEAAVAQHLSVDLAAAVRLNIAALDLPIGPGDSIAREDVGSLLAQLVAPSIAAPGALPLVCAEIIDRGAYVRLDADAALAHLTLKGWIGHDVAECFSIPLTKAAEAARPLAPKLYSVELFQPRAEALGWATAKLQIGGMTVIAAYGYGEPTAISDGVRLDGSTIHGIAQHLAKKRPPDVSMFDLSLLFGVVSAVDDIHPTSSTQH